MSNNFMTFSASEVTSSPVSSSTVLRRNNVHVIGQGKPPMLLCTGFGCHQRVWQYMVTALATRHQVILFDYVGMGESDPQAYDAAKYSTLHGYAQDVIEICQALDLHDAVLVGHSVGATIAMLAAIKAPQYFSKAVLLTPSPYYLNEPGYYGGFEREDMLHVLAELEAEHTTWSNMLADVLMGPTNLSSVREELAGFFCEIDSTIVKNFARVAFLSDNRADVPLLRLPTLVLQCTDDVAGPPEVGAYLMKHLPNAELVTLRATGHCPHLSAPIETLAAMRAYLN